MTKPKVFAISMKLSEFSIVRYLKTCLFISQTKTTKKTRSNLKKPANKQKEKQPKISKVVAQSAPDSTKKEQLSSSSSVVTKPLQAPPSDWNYKFLSWNINGVRAFLKNTSMRYLEEEDAFCSGFQEIKCESAQFPANEFRLSNAPFARQSSAARSGYAGTAILARQEPISVQYGIGRSQHDEEGRVITAEFPQFYFVTAYVPNSGRGLVRLKYRTKEWDRDFAEYLQRLDSAKPLIVCGDLNVAHRDIDLANPESNKRTAGFTQEERDSFSALFLDKLDLVDTFRHLYPEQRNAFTFWSYMRNARANNIGWRLDYFLISRRLLPNLRDHQIRSEQKGSDHCPIVLYMKF